jgi:hypothetical protein
VRSSRSSAERRLQFVDLFHLLCLLLLGSSSADLTGQPALSILSHVTPLLCHTLQLRSDPRLCLLATPVAVLNCALCPLVSRLSTCSLSLNDAEASRNECAHINFAANLTPWSPRAVLCPSNCNACIIPMGKYIGQLAFKHCASICSSSRLWALVWACCESSLAGHT